MRKTNFMFDLVNMIRPRSKHKRAGQNKPAFPRFWCPKVTDGPKYTQKPGRFPDSGADERPAPSGAGLYRVGRDVPALSVARVFARTKAARVVIILTGRADIVEEFRDLEFGCGFLFGSQFLDGLAAGLQLGFF